MLAKARAMAGVSIQMEDNNALAALLAKQAYIFNNRHFGKKYDPFIHSALYTALTKIDGNSYNAIAVPGPARNRINSVSLSKKSNSFTSQQQMVASTKEIWIIRVSNLQEFKIAILTNLFH